MSCDADSLVLYTVLFPLPYSFLFSFKQTNRMSTILTGVILSSLLLRPPTVTLADESRGDEYGHSATGLKPVYIVLQSTSVVQCTHSIDASECHTEESTLADNLSVCVVPNITFTLDRNHVSNPYYDIRHSAETPSNQLMCSNVSLANKQRAFIINAISVCRDIFTAEANGLPYV